MCRHAYTHIIVYEAILALANIISSNIYSKIPASRILTMIRPNLSFPSSIQEEKNATPEQSLHPLSLRAQANTGVAISRTHI